MCRLYFFFKSVTCPFWDNELLSCCGCRSDGSHWNSTEPPAAHSTVKTFPLLCCCRCVMSPNRRNTFLLKEQDSNIFRSCKNPGWTCWVILHIYGVSRSSSGRFNSRFNSKYEKVWALFHSIKSIKQDNNFY